MQTFRVFVSSPADAAVERRRAENVVARLNGEFAGLARLVAVRWETSYYQAHDTFQAQIPLAADCDLVVGILKWRLGTALPPGFPEALPSGEPYPSGTAYELLTAIGKRQHGADLPDVYVFRFTGGSPNPQLDDPDRLRIEREWEALRGFIHRWFETPEGHFVAAFNPYRSEDDFETQLENLLRRWCAEKVAGGRSLLWPQVKGSPFRGLSVFGARHAPVFFGRQNDIRRAVEQWRGAQAKGTPFLLVVGASGSGKSSLARAGLLPRLATPGVVAEVDLWRTAVMRPGDAGAGPFAALADALLQSEADLPADEEGRGPALPEITQGDSKTSADLAAVLAHADVAAVQPVLGALGRVAEQARNLDHYGRALRCDLVLLVDQLDEIFAASLDAGQRDRFAELLAALVRSGRVWLVATLRADLYGRLLEMAALKQLKDAGASYDLAPPGHAELAEIVRGPAAAAGLVFETDPATGERVDERLLREADRADMLPLVQLALSRLYEARETVEGQIRLPLSAYAGNGGLKGLIEEAGEKAIAPLGEPERERLPALIRQLAEIRRAGNGPADLTGRAAPLAAAAPDEPARRLVDALVAARLLTLTGEGEAAQLRLAHQRVLSDWSRAASVVAASGDFYRIRDDTERQRQRWEAGNRRRELLLARGLPLAEAQSIAERFRGELAPDTRAFIDASRRRANRTQMIGWAAAALFGLVALGALAEWRLAAAANDRADRNFAAAKQAVNGLIFNIAEGLKGVAGMRVETVRKILETVRGTVDQLFATDPHDIELQHSRGIMLGAFGETYLAAGDLADAKQATDQSVEALRRLVEQDPGNRHLRHNLSLMLQQSGAVALRQGERTAAMGAYQEALAIDRAAVARFGDAVAQQDLAVALQQFGDARWEVGDADAALAAYDESLGLLRALVAKGGDRAVQRNLTVVLDDVGAMKLQRKDAPAALAAYRESLAINRRLAAQDPGDAQAQRDLSVDLENIGDVLMRSGDTAGALAADTESLAIRRTLAAQDPGNAEAQRDLSLILESVADIALASADLGKVQAAYAEDLDIRRRLLARDPGDTRAKADLAQGLTASGLTWLKQGTATKALPLLKEAVDLRRALAGDGGSDQARQQLAASLQQLGQAAMLAGDSGQALAAFEESADLFRILAGKGRDPALRRALALDLERAADLKMRAGDQAGAAAALREGVDLRRALVKEAGDLPTQRALAVALGSLGDVERQQKADQEALAAYAESLGIVRAIAARAPDSPVVQSDLLIDLERVGIAKSGLGDRSGAADAYAEAVAVRRAVAARSGDDAAAQHDLAVTLAELGDARQQLGARADALAAYTESLAIARKLAARDGTPAQAKLDVVVALARLSTVADDPLPIYREGLGILEGLDHDGKLDQQGKHWMALIRDKLDKAAAASR